MIVVSCQSMEMVWRRDMRKLDTGQSIKTNDSRRTRHTLETNCEPMVLFGHDTKYVELCNER